MPNGSVARCCNHSSDWRLATRTGVASAKETGCFHTSKAPGSGRQFSGRTPTSRAGSPRSMVNQSAASEPASWASTVTPSSVLASVAD